MITIILIVSGAILLTSGYVLVTSLVHAPDGFEDENGFHFSPKAAVARKPRATRRAAHGSRRIRTSTVGVH